MDLIDWFNPWLARHIARHPGRKLPDPTTTGGAIFFDSWRDRFAQSNVRQDVAEAASKALMTRNHYVADHFATLMKLINEARYGGIAAAARDASADCRECYGTGFASVRDRDSGRNYAAYCICDFGRHQLGKAQATAKEGTQHIDLAAIRRGITYRAAALGTVVTLDFAEDDDDLDDGIKFLPKGLREKAERLREQERTEAWA